MKKRKISNKVLAIILITLLLAIGLLTTAWALFSQNKNQETGLSVGTINVELIEDWPEEGDKIEIETETGTVEETYDEFGITRNSKVVYGKSTGNIPAYVRIRCIPIVEYYLVEDETTQKGEWVVAPIAQSDIVISVEGEEWIKSGEYYYYKNVLGENEETGKLNINWQITEIPTEIADYDIRANVKVVLEFSQASHEKWKEIFNINQLPEGVESVE